MAADVLTTQRLELDDAEAPEIVERLRAALPGYLAERDGLISAALYCSRNGMEALLVGRWHEFAEVTRSMELIHAKSELLSGVQSSEFKVYALVDEVRAEPGRR